MLALGGAVSMPSTPQELQNLPNPADMSQVALGAAAVGTLETSIAGPPQAPPLVEDGISPPAVDDAPAPDDNDADISPDDAGETPKASSSASNIVPGAMDMMSRATQEMNRQAAGLRATQEAKHPPLVSQIICAKAAKELKAMSCSMVTQISGYPEGCECRMKAKKCPAVRKDLGFTGVSPSIPLAPPQLGGVTVMLCMYWQWLKPVDRSADAKLEYDKVRELATNMVKGAHANAELGARIIATANYYAATPPPIPPTTSYPIAATPEPIFQPVRILSTTPYMPYFPSAFAMAPAPGPFPGPAPGPAPSVTFMPGMFNPMFLPRAPAPGPAPSPFFGFATPAPALPLIPWYR